MKIWIARHGQTELNRKKLMQGRTDAPLNEKGIAQAKQSRKNIGDVHFDAVYASPLQRAILTGILTGSIIGDVDPSEIIVDPRIIETDFGRYEKRRYYALGLPMTAYWTMPRIFPAPPTVETIDSMKERASSNWRPRTTRMCLSHAMEASCAHCAAISTRRRTDFTGSA